MMDYMYVYTQTQPDYTARLVACAKEQLSQSTNRALAQCADCRLY